MVKQIQDMECNCWMYDRQVCNICMGLHPVNSIVDVGEEPEQWETINGQLLSTLGRVAESTDGHIEFGWPLATSTKVSKLEPTSDSIFSNSYQRKPILVDAFPVRLLLGFARNNWKALPTWMKEAYDRGEVVFLRDEISVKNDKFDFRASKDDMIIFEPETGVMNITRSAFAKQYSKVW